MSQVNSSWVELGGSREAAEYLALMDGGTRRVSLLQQCSPEQEQQAAEMCKMKAGETKHFGLTLVVGTCSRRSCESSGYRRYIVL